MDPQLKLQGTPLPLDGVQCQTVLSKCLGPFDTWEDKVAVTAASGYNMLHFTPIQALGGSNSAYSLKDHMALNDTFSSDGKLTFDDVKAFLARMEEQNKVS